MERLAGLYSASNVVSDTHFPRLYSASNVVSDTHFPVNLRHLAAALGGEISGDQVLAPGPNHSAADRSMAVKPDQTVPDGFLVHSFANDDPIACKKYVREKCGLPPFKANDHRHRSHSEVANLLRQAVLSQQQQPRTVPTATYNYTNAEGVLLYQVLRTLNRRAFGNAARTAMAGGFGSLTSAVSFTAGLNC